MADVTNYSGLKGADKAAIMLMALNPDNASRVFAMLHDEEIKELSQRMSAMGAVSPDVIRQLFMEFSSMMSEAVSFVGNVENTEKLLASALGKERKDAIMEDIKGPAGRNTWDKLSNVSEEVLANYLRNEYPQTAALIVSRLKATHAAKVLAALPEDLAFDVMTRLLDMDNVKKEALDSVEKALRVEFISSVSRSNKRDGNEMLAEIFNSFDRQNESKYMGMLERYSSDSAEKIKKMMFTFDDLSKSDAAGLQSLLRRVDRAALPLALKGAAEKVRDMFFQNMSSRAAKILAEEIESLGPVRLKDVDSAQSSIIIIAKELVASGEMTLKDEDGGDDILI